MTSIFFGIQKAELTWMTEWHFLNHSVFYVLFNILILDMHNVINDRSRPETNRFRKARSVEEPDLNPANNITIWQLQCKERQKQIHGEIRHIEYGDFCGHFKIILTSKYARKTIKLYMLFPHGRYFSQFRFPLCLAWHLPWSGMWSCHLLHYLQM